jgi:hypothetical protein
VRLMGRECNYSSAGMFADGWRISKLLFKEVTSSENGSNFTHCLDEFSSVLPVTLGRYSYSAVQIPS